LTDAKSHLVEVIDGRCGKYTINDDLAQFNSLYDDDGNCVDFRGNPADGPKPACYQYGYYIMAIDSDTESLVELDARLTNGGLHTKAANL